jgi:hypothetical protein
MESSAVDLNTHAAVGEGSVVISKVWAFAHHAA